MSLITKSKITGFSSYVPEKILNNFDLEKMVDTNNEWILQRTGVRERHICAEDEFASDLGYKAALDLRNRLGVNLDDVDILIVTTFTPDHFTPHTAATIQGKLGIKNCGTFDLGAGCAGFEYALATADSLVSSGHFKKALVIAAESLSKVVDYTDRSSCILFGDAGAACIVEASDKAHFFASHFTSDGDIGYYVTTTAHSQKVLGKVVEKEHIFDQDGQLVYKYAVRNVPIGVGRLLEKAGLALDDIDWFIPHSANLRIIEGISKKLGLSMDKVLTSVELNGNTSSASIPLALSMAQKAGKIKSGDKAILYGFGGGLTHGGVIIEL